ncbi:hypothetical protein C9374_001466 [Naegleria lovaniensis]|uniref:Transmembrane protein 18 n=1 Tax=Naegleria lovaniensis TaxID=51637 RepID=A0AA88GVP3_NAELO|nr:uncharacterized protein C9374_001466 [Naegleria lovaniensis]KAG2387872.1 hypothetical protein C9374_001466 [Naegleria lovaniensis]
MNFLNRVLENQAKLFNLFLFSLGLANDTASESHGVDSEPSKNHYDMSQAPLSKVFKEVFANGTFQSDVLIHYIVDGFSQFKSDAKSFINSVYWREEYWLQGVIAMHIVFLTCIIMSRKNMNMQALLFGLICVMTYLSESLNRWCNANWQLFSTMNYFDGRGFFTAVVYAFPLLFLLFIIVVNMIITSAQMVIKVKRRQLQRQRQKEQNNRSNSQNSNSNRTEGTNTITRQ